MGNHRYIFLDDYLELAKRNPQIGILCRFLRSWLQGNPRYIDYIELAKRKPLIHRFLRSWLKRNPRYIFLDFLLITYSWLKQDHRYIDYFESAKRKPQMHRLLRVGEKETHDTQSWLKGNPKYIYIHSWIPQSWLKGIPRYRDSLELAKRIRKTLDEQITQSRPNENPRHIDLLELTKKKPQRGIFLYRFLRVGKN